MDWEYKILEGIGDDGGCIFPVLDKDGKRRQMCGEKTPVLDENGNKRPFCAKHEKIVRQYINRQIRAKRQGKKVKSTKMKVGKRVVH